MYSLLEPKDFIWASILITAEIATCLCLGKVTAGLHKEATVAGM